MKKKFIVPVLLLLCALTLSACSKVDVSNGLSGSNAPQGNPPEGMAPPEDGGNPPPDMPVEGEGFNGGTIEGNI